MPVACAGCFSQHDVPHVDFRTVFEGPVLDPENPRAGRVDWLVLCEGCIRQAHACLDDDERAAKLAQLERQVEQLTQRAEDAERYSERLEDAVSHRPDRVERQAPAAPRPARKARYAPKS